MGNLKVVHKGVYPYPADNDYVRLIQYMFVEENGEKFALLRFVNDDESAVKGIKILFEQTGVDGAAVSSGEYECVGLNVKHKQKFAFDKKIKIEKDCFDFKVKVLKVDFGKFVYNASGAEKGVTFVKSETPPRAHAGAYVKKEKKLRISVILSLLFCGVMLAASAAITISVNNYKSTEDGFILQNVNYTFVDGNKKEEVVVSGYRGKASRIEIPEKAGGHLVVKIDKDAFKGKTSVNRLTIKGAPVISDRAFMNCTGLEKLDLGGVTNIGEKAFYGCISLKGVGSDKLLSVGASAFQRCESLTDVNISHDGVLALGERAFDSCRKLNSVKIDCFIDYAKGGAGKFFNGCGTISEMSLKNYNYKKYGYLANNGSFSSLFSGTLVRVDGAENLTVEYTDEIFASMLSGDKVLKTFTVKNIENADIAEKAFSGCENLTSIDLPLSPTIVGAEAFKDSGLKDFDFSKVTRINKQAFSGCKNLISDLKDGLLITDIREKAFENCASLTKVNLSPAITNLGAGVFSGCVKLEEVNGLNKISLTTLPQKTFENCESLSGAVLPGMVTTIGTAAFKNCKSMATFVAPNDLETVADEAFAGCASLKKIDLKTVCSLGALSLSECTSLEELRVPDTLTSLGLGAFYGDTALTKLTLPSFCTAATLRNLFLKDGEAVVPESLKTVVLTDVNNFAEGALAGVPSLEEVTISGIYGVDVARLFEGATGLKKLTLPYFGTVSGWFGDETPCNLETVRVTEQTDVPAIAFRNAKRLRTIDFDKDLVSIGQSAFHGCIHLEKFRIPETMPDIGASAFDMCYKLYEVFDESGTINKGQLGYGGIARYAVKVYSDEKDAPEKKIIDGYKFIFDKDLNESNGAWLYADYNGTDTDLTFPATIVNEKGDAIDEFRIADYLFYKEAEITSVAFGKVSYFGKCAFFACEAVKTVTVAEGSTFTEISAQTFTSCKNLGAIYMPSVTTIGNEAFDGCARLESVAFSLSNAVGNNAFNGCVRLHEVKNKGSLNIVKGDDGNGSIALYAIGVYDNLSSGLKVETEGGVTYKNSGEYGDRVWYATGYSGVSGTANVNYASAKTIKIAPYAFEGLETLKNVTTDSKLNEIGKNAFFGCAGLEKIDLSSSSGLEEIQAGVFEDCAALKTFAAPSVATIADDALKGCVAVENLTIPSVKESDASFYNVKTGLAKIFGVDNNNGLTALKTITLTNCYSLPNHAFRELSVQTVTLPNKLTSIGNYAFYNSQNLESVNIPDGVTYIGESAFAQCESLKSIKLPKNLTTVSNYAFSNCYSLESVTFPANLTEIGKYALACSAIKSLPISGTRVYDIAEGAFEGCGALEEANFPQTLMSIGDYAFENTALKSLNLKSTRVATIGKEAFYNCISLETASFPSSLNSIGDSSFKNTALKELLLIGTNVSTIGRAAFDGVKTLTKATFPASLRSIDEAAFRDCTNLLQVNDLSRKLTAGSEGYGMAAYYAIRVYNNSNSNLTYATSGNFKFAKGDGDWYLYDYVANYGDEVILPESFISGSLTVKTYCIHKNAFKNYMSSIVIREGVKSIDGEAFGNNVPNTVYYEGTKSEWSRLTKPPVLISRYVYFYDKCAHEGGQWKFVNGRPASGPYEINSTNGKQVVIAEPSCTDPGRAYYECNTCGKRGDAFTLSPLGHNLTRYPAKAATEYEYATIEYWYCERCKKYFKDRYGKEEIDKREIYIKK